MADKGRQLEWTQIRDLNFLVPELQGAAQIILDKAKQRGLDIRMTETYRSPEHQALASESGASQTMLGWHPEGRAVDFGVFDDKGEYLGMADDYEPLGEIISEVIEENPEFAELIWGGDWDKPDMPHVELHPGYGSTEYERYAEESAAYIPPSGMLTAGE